MRRVKADGTAFHTVGYTYGSGSSLSDMLSRVATVTVGSGPTTVATYDYLGGGHLVGTSLNQAELNTSVFTESGGTHRYGDLDGFNRPTRWNWERPGGAAGGFYNVAIAYDENSNPTSTVDDVHVRLGNGKHLGFAYSSRYRYFPKCCCPKTILDIQVLQFGRASLCGQSWYHGRIVSRLSRGHGESILIRSIVLCLVCITSCCVRGVWFLVFSRIRNTARNNNT